MVYVCACNDNDIYGPRFHLMAPQSDTVEGARMRLRRDFTGSQPSSVARVITGFGSSSSLMPRHTT